MRAALHAFDAACVRLGRAERACRADAAVMILLVNGATATVRRYAGHPALGRLVQPRSGNDIGALAACGMPWAADNDALAGVQPDALLAMWNAIAAADTSRLLFVTAPDAVELTPAGPRGDWHGTRWLWRCWLPALRARNLPAAIVAQDGATAESVPWDDIRALFIGGSDAFKLGPAAAMLCGSARARGVHVHVGRVNSMRRLGYIERMGADSFDGGQFSMFPDTYIPRYLARLEYRQHHMEAA